MEFALGACVCVLLSACALSGQAISGRVVDPGNGPIPSARVRIYPHSLTGFRTEALTDSNGRFRLAGLAPDAYALVVASPGFQERTNTTVATESGHEADLGSIRLELGRCNQLVGSCDGVAIDQSPLAEPPPRLSRRWIGPPHIYVLTICELVQNFRDYDAAIVVVVGRIGATGEGAWLSGDCGPGPTIGGVEWKNLISLSYVAREYADPPLLPNGFDWNPELIEDALRELQKTTRLRAGQNDAWQAVYGRVEAINEKPITWQNSNGSTTTLKEGFGHLNGAVIELIAPRNGYHAFQ